MKRTFPSPFLGPCLGAALEKVGTCVCWLPHFMGQKDVQEKSLSDCNVRVGLCRKRAALEIYRQFRTSTAETKGYYWGILLK